VDNVSAHDNYPVHILGRMVPKRFPPLTKEYIPHLGRLLNEAINEGDSQKIQVSIRALGNVGHPSILPFFEPYLEGKKNASKFQRLLMVSALDKLAKVFPKEAAAVLLKLYQNTGENHEIRCVAVSLLMRTNPPANTLQRMAEFTNADPDPQVSSMVQSAILSAANLQDPSNLEL
jgi:predicted Zn-dependent protease